MTAKRTPAERPNDLEERMGRLEGRMNAIVKQGLARRQRRPRQLLRRLQMSASQGDGT